MFSKYIEIKYVLYNHNIIIPKKETIKEIPTYEDIIIIDVSTKKEEIK